MDQPSLIHEISRGEVFAVIPEYGSVRLPFSELLGDEEVVRGCCCSILVVTANDESFDFLGFTLRFASIAAA